MLLLFFRLLLPARCCLLACLWLCAGERRQDVAPPATCIEANGSTRSTLRDTVLSTLILRRFPTRRMVSNAILVQLLMLGQHGVLGQQGFAFALRPLVCLVHCQDMCAQLNGDVHFECGACSGTAYKCRPGADDFPEGKLAETKRQHEQLEEEERQRELRATPQLVEVPQEEELAACPMPTLQAMCLALARHGAVSFCRSEAIVDALRALAPLVPWTLLEDDQPRGATKTADSELWLAEAFVFPGAHVVEHGTSGFPFGAESGNPQMFCAAGDSFTVRVVEPASQLEGGHRVATLKQQVKAGIGRLIEEDATGARCTDEAFFSQAVAAAVRVFEACVRRGLDAEPGGPEVWTLTRSAALCRALGWQGLHMIERRLKNAGSRDDHNRLVRLLVDNWGSPTATAGLLLLFGCGESRPRLGP